MADVADVPRYRFVRGDIADAEAATTRSHGVDAVVNFAAESHVDRSHPGAGDFIRTDVVGTRCCWRRARGAGVRRFVQVSTDEVYGAPRRPLSRDRPLEPSSPYSASKAGGDLRCWPSTHLRRRHVITRGSNTFGPHQYPEKLIPLFITNALDGEPLPVYGDGCRCATGSTSTTTAPASTALERGTAGEVYNVGGGNEVANLEMTRRILELTGRDESLVRHVTDRPGHDRRYALDTAKLRALGWAPGGDFGTASRARWPGTPSAATGGSRSSPGIPGVLRGAVRESLRADSASRSSSSTARWSWSSWPSSPTARRMWATSRARNSASERVCSAVFRSRSPRSRSRSACRVWASRMSGAA